MTGRLIGSSLPHRSSSPVRIKVECCRSHDHCDYRVMNGSAIRIPSSIITHRRSRPAGNLIGGLLLCKSVVSIFYNSRSSRLHLVLAQGYCIWVLAGRPAFARPCEGVHRSMSFMSLSLLLQQCLACIVRLTWIVFVMGGCIAAALWGATFRTRSILLAAFLCKCRQAFSPYV